MEDEVGKYRKKRNPVHQSQSINRNISTSIKVV